MNIVDRNTDYDFLRFVGIACIILAHIKPNALAFQIRNFDVPLMVLLSGISFGMFSSNSYTSYSKYLLNRFLRLIIPTWLFMIFLNIVFFILKNHTPTFKDVLMQITLTGGIDIGIWIVRIFFTMAIIAPFLNKVNNSLKNNNIFYSILLSSWLVYETLVESANAYLPHSYFTLCNFLLFFTISYGCIFLFGLRLPQINKRQLQTVIIVCFAIFILGIFLNFLIQQELVPTQAFKYPPRLYYISYALAISLSLIYLTTYSSIFTYLKQNPFVQFVGKSTLWIYLWHWFVIQVYAYLAFEAHMIFKYIFIFSLATLITYIQSKLVIMLPNIISLKNGKHKIIRTIFTG